jgi:hypothetical protein
MKKSPQYLRRTLRQAHALQARYTALGAPSTQNIRNPLPMRKLVVSVLPVLPDLDAIVNVQTTTKCKFNGRTFTRKTNGKAYARDIVPLDQWRKNGMTVDDVMGDLERRGFIVRSATTVRCMLSQALGSRWSNVQSVSQPNGTGRGRPRKLYFATE